MYKFKKIVGSNNFLAKFIKIIPHYKKIGFKINVLQQTACFVVNSISSRFAALLSSLIARWWVGLQTLQMFRFKDLSFDEMVGLIFWWDGRGLMLWLSSGLPGFTCWVSFAPIFSFMYCWVLIFALSLFISWCICSRRWCMDELGVFHANQTSMCLRPHLNKGEVGAPWNRLKPSNKILLLTVPRRCFFCGSIMLIPSCVCYEFACICLLIPCGHLLEKGWLLGSRLWCPIVCLSLSHVVSWVRCGTWLYRLLIFALFLTLIGT